MLPLDKVWESNPDHDDIPWSKIDARWNDPDWDGWQQLWLGNEQLQSIKSCFNCELIKNMWKSVRRSYVQEKEFLNWHPELYWTIGEPAAFCKKHPGVSAPDFTSSRTGRTVELKSAPTRELALNRAETLDKTNYINGHHAQYSSHGADFVVFTDLTLNDEDEWNEWIFVRQTNGDYKLEQEIKHVF